MKRIPTMLGIVVAVFWLLSFAVAFSTLRFGEADDGASSWWDIAVFREPGFWLGEIIFNLAERLPGIDYGHILGQGLPLFLLSLVVTSLALGFITWLIAHKVVVGVLRRRSV